jgi:hypothetical protein
MDIRELEDFKLSDAVKFHNELNPNLWENNKLKPEVKKQLLKIANDFILELGVAIPKIQDITISGSNAAYSYTPYSDLDLHILVDFNQLPDDEIYQELFTAKKNLYNDEHDISVHGVPVELYVQDSNQPHISLGEYSIVNDEWIRIPKKQKANFDQNETRAKYEKLGSMIELALNSNSLDKVEKVLDVLKRYRKAGLQNKGEFGPENLSYKALRKLGYIQKLYDYKDQLHSKELSLEDYDPNGPPPGPEFPPTMPSGTVRVDVSDVYDWYKLGQHISNMKGLGKHDFGKGPPSTILSFGDEDLEHQYIDALKKTGLDTTDIDPKAHDTKKGQKVDPTYNVNESKQKVIEGTNCKNCVWWKKDSEKSVGKDELNSNGGLKPPNKEYIAMSKRVDLVTLPGKDTVKVKGFCYHKDINDWVTERMCCAKWDAKGVIRDYKGESPLMEVLDPTSAYDISWSDKIINNNQVYTALATDKQGRGIAIDFYEFDDYGLTAIEFSRYNSFDITKSGEQFNVFATVLEATKKYLNFENPPKYILFAAKEKSRAKLYQTFINRFASQLGYKQISNENIPNELYGHIVGKNDVGFLLARVDKIQNEASGYIPSEKEKNDPRFKTALTIDVKPDSIAKNAKAFGSNVSRAGIPPQAKTNGKI